MTGISMNSIAAFPERHGGGARVSVFFALWTLALVVLNDVRVNAAPIYDASPTRSGPTWWSTPPRHRQSRRLRCGTVWPSEAT